jgi:hypothetical protein
MSSKSGEARPELSEGITECRWLTLEDAVRTVTYENARVILGRAGERLGLPVGDDGASHLAEGRE